MNIVESPIRINLGCGTNAPERWENFDSSLGLFLARHGLQKLFGRLHLITGEQANVQWPHNVRRRNVTKGLPYADGSVDAAHSSHMLEHLYLPQAAQLLGEVRRVLRPGGVLRLAVPDLRSEAETYLKSEEPDVADEFLRGLGMKGTLLEVPDLCSAVQKYLSSAKSDAADEFLRGIGVKGPPRGLKGLVPELRGSKHRWMYDESSLAAMCMSSGFEEVKRYNFREGKCPDLEFLDNRPDSLFIEAYVGLTGTRG
ncbi:MAG: methyltransferase domain-containing protein [Patescibacteria group bacterium]|nr:methyltransferase domain-containing protein [Patescibacteria group bacterium]